MREIPKRYLSTNFLVSKFLFERSILDMEELVFDKERSCPKEKEIISGEKMGRIREPLSINWEDPP